MALLTPSLTRTGSRSVWLPRMAALLLAAAAAASAAYWGLRAMGSTPLGTALAVDVGASSLDAALVARALGASATGSSATPASGTAAPVAESGRFALLGVLAGRNAQGAALVAVDGKAAKPFVVGAALVDGWTLQSVQGRHAVLARGGAALALELPPQGLAIKGGIKP